MIRTFIINLPVRTDRRKSVTIEMDRIKLGYRFWRAVTHPSSGVMGLIETMKYLLEYCIANGYAKVLILEDDVRFLETRLFVDKCIAQLPDDFDLMYLGCNLAQNKVELFSPNLIKVDGAYATHAILYSNSGMKKVYDILKRGSDSPLDVQIVHGVQADGNCYACYPMAGTQVDSYSDIEQRDVRYRQLLEDRFEQKTQHLK